MYCPACGTGLPPQATFCPQCGGKLPAAPPKEGDPRPVAPTTPLASEAPLQAPPPAPDAAPSDGGGRSKLGEDVGALGCAVLLFFGGGGLAVMESKWGKWALVVGGLIALVGMVSANATFWALLKRLGKRK